MCSCGSPPTRFMRPGRNRENLLQSRASGEIGVRSYKVSYVGQRNQGPYSLHLLTSRANPRRHTFWRLLDLARSIFADDPLVQRFDFLQPDGSKASRNSWHQPLGDLQRLI